MRKLTILIGLLILSGPMVKAQQVQPPNGLSPLAAYSIFLENYRAESYESAIQFGSWIHKNMPRKLKGYSGFDLEKNLDRLVTAYSELANQKEDPSLHEAYADTALMIFDKVFGEFSEDEIDYFEWRLYYGRIYQEHTYFIDNARNKAIEQYKMAFEMDPERATQEGDGYYINAVVRTLVSQGEKEEALNIIKRAEPYANQNILDYFDQVRNRLFDSPKERIAYFEEKLAENPEDETVLNELADLYEENEMIDKASELNQKLYELNPSYENTKSLADFAISNANYDKAIQYLKEALNKTDDSDDLKEVNLELSEAYMNKEDLQSARRYARQARNHDSQWGKPYLQMAKIYSQAVNQCTSGRNMERFDRAVYWLVEDYLNKAKNVDQSVRSQANSRLKAYEPVMPTSEDVFFTEEWTEGEQITIGQSLDPCYSWVNEKTTVR